jgi:hypothetical protein
MHRRRGSVIKAAVAFIDVVVVGWVKTSPAAEFMLGARLRLSRVGNWPSKSLADSPMSDPGSPEDIAVRWSARVASASVPSEVIVEASRE